MNFCAKCGFPAVTNLNLCPSCLLELWCEGARQLRERLSADFRDQLDQPIEDIWKELTK